MKATEAKVLGLSADGRTQRWRVVCPQCGTAFEPGTTLRAHQHLTCPQNKCDAEMIAHYNDEPPMVRLVTTEA